MRRRLKACRRLFHSLESCDASPREPQWDTGFRLSSQFAQINDIRWTTGLVLQTKVLPCCFGALMVCSVATGGRTIVPSKHPTMESKAGAGESDSFTFSGARW